MSTLRQRIRKKGISPQPWSFWKGEIPYFCISAKSLFKNSGIDFHIIERELTEEGWILPSESLIEILKNNERLMQKQVWDFDSSYGCIPDDYEPDGSHCLSEIPF